MLLRNAYYRITLDDHDGRLLSLKNAAGKELVRSESRRPLLEFRLRDSEGNPIVVSSNSSRAVFEEGAAGMDVVFRNLGGLPLDATVKIRLPVGEAMSYWSLEVANASPHAIEWVTLPVVAVPNDLVGAGGDARIVYPICEGVLVEDAALRNKMGHPFSPVEYPCRGLEGLYPGSVASQFMAYYGDGGGLYFAAHDPTFSTKTMDYHADGAGVELEFRLFTSGEFGQGFKLPYEMALGVFDGDWHDAAELYRDWLDSQQLPACKPLKEDTTLPAWLCEPTLVVTYPVRGTHDMDKMEPNEFYPYTNALKHLDHLAAAANCSLLVLLMHWESTAPWAPPYVWPPYGDQEDFNAFVEALHQRGHKVGVYASGIGWTLRSKVVDYQGPPLPDGAKFEDTMCVAPDGTLPFSKICCGHRDGFDLCPASELTSQIALEEILKMAEAKLDYAQYFDQNMGGGGYFCYAKNHQHPPMPGEWLSSSVADMARRITTALSERGSPMLVGCEGAAAEPFIPFMRFNDLRYNVGMFYGKPIPLFSYLYHEKAVNFMGNQVCSGQIIDNIATPGSLLFRIAYSFVAGDHPTVVLKGGGEIHWAWGTKWEVPAPAQEPIVTLLRNISEARRGPAKEFLCHGRMLKPLETRCASTATIKLNSGDTLEYQPVLSTRWRVESGEEAQIFVNHTESPQTVELSLPDGTEERFEIAPLAVHLRHLDDGATAKVAKAGRHFTLVEMLVVIVVISILSSILLPALSKARESGKRICCNSNMRQIYQGCAMYVNDSDGWMPPTLWSSQHLYHLRDYIGLSPERGGGYTDHVIQLLCYKKPVGVLFCPSLSSIPQRSAYWQAGAGATASYYLSSYMQTLTTSSSDPGCWTHFSEGFHRRFERIKDNCVIIADKDWCGVSSMGNPMYVCGVTAPGYLAPSEFSPGWIHGGTANFLFKDGHVASYSARTTFDSNYVPRN